MKSGKKVLVLGSFAPSLVHFRGPLISAIVGRGHRVVAAAPEIDSATAEALRVLGAEPHEIALRNVSLSPTQLINSYRGTRALIEEVKPDVIIAYTIKPVIVGALAGRAKGVKTIVSLITGAGYAFTGGREVKRLVSRAAASLLYRLALARSDVIIFQNPDDEALFRRLGLVARGRATKVVNGSGVDLAHFAPAPLPTQPAFLMIARLLKDKGVREFAQAAKRLKAEHPNVPVALVGRFDPSPDSLSQQELNELIGAGVEYQGFMADVRSAITKCSVYVLPSYREGTPRSVLEAMAMGRPVITTDAPGCRETVRAGENGFLIPARDADALYDAMLRFVEDPAIIPRMGARSLEIAKSKYDVDAVNADVLNYAGLE